MKPGLVPIPGHPSYYASRDGHVYGPKGWSLKPDTGSVRIGKVRIQIAWAVLRTFGGPPPTPQHTVGFVNGNPKDRNIKNLYWYKPDRLSRLSVNLFAPLSDRLLAYASKVQMPAVWIVREALSEFLTDREMANDPERDTTIGPLPLADIATLKAEWQRVKRVRGPRITSA